jgi:hypothetical protein
LTIAEAQPLEGEQEKKQPWQFVKWIFKVLYSPINAFEEIVENPNVKGPILILLIILPIILGGQYISGTKFFLENPKPENDLWTEKPSNSEPFLWNSNDNIAFDNNDYIIGNFSISSSLTNSSLIWMRLTDIGSFNCSKEEYSRLSFRIKWINEANVTPTAVLQLFSLNNESNRFELDIGPLVANSTDVWANVTVSLATDSWIKVPEGLPSWANVTGIGFQLLWSSTADFTAKIDDLFFGKYVLISSLSTFGMQLLYSVMRSGVDLLLEWLILSGIVLLALKSFSDWNGSWKNLLSCVGYIYSTSIVYFGVLAVLFLVLPPILLPYNITYLEYIDLYQGSWGIPTSILTLLSYGWAIILCTVACKKLEEFSWSKAFIIGFGAVVMSLLFSSILLSLFL